MLCPSTPAPRYAASVFCFLGEMKMKHFDCDQRFGLSD